MGVYVKRGCRNRGMHEPNSKQIPNRHASCGMQHSADKRSAILRACGRVYVQEASLPSGGVAERL